MAFMKRFFGKSADDDSSEEKGSTSPTSEENNTSNTLESEPTAPVLPSPSSNADVVTSLLDGATRPLPPEVQTASMSGHMTFGQTTDVGMVRNNNQDSAYTFFSMSNTVEELPDFGLFIVADGMGGHSDGEKASSITVRQVAKNALETIYLPMIHNNNQHDADRPPVSELLALAVKSANDAVLQDVPDGGTTLTAVLVIGEWSYIAHVGDSRAYLVTKEGVEQLTRDHSLVQRLIELNQLTPESREDYPQRNVLYRAVGQNETLEVDTITRRLPAQASILICSDGLWGVISNNQIRELIATSSTPQDACDKLVALANTMGSTDNITAVIVKMPVR